MTQRGRRTAHSGVSLLELIIVLTIIGIMASLLFPAIHMVVQESRKTACDNNVHQLSIAMQSYMELTRGCIPVAPWDNRPSGWAIALLPFTEEIALADQFDSDALLTSRGNLAAAANRPNYLVCPVTPHTSSTIDGIDVTNYVLMVDDTRRERPPQRRFWRFQDAPEGSRYPWCSSPERKWPEENYPRPHSTAFGF